MMQRVPWLLLVLIGALLSGCLNSQDPPSAGDDDDDYTELGRLEVELIVPPNPDPFGGNDAYHVLITAPTGTLVDEVFPAGAPIEIQALEATAEVTVVLEGLDGAGDVVSRGRTLPFDLVEEFNVTVPMYFALVDTFSDVSGAPEARTGPAFARLSDGRVLVAGGQVAGAAVATAEIYDPATDVSTPIDPMNAPHAHSTAVMLDLDTILVAGGVDDNGDPTDTADVFVYDATAHAGTWVTGVPTMPNVHAGAANIALANNRALVAGGRNGNGPINETDAFEWDGLTGSWNTGPNMNNDREAPIGVPAGTDLALIGGGFTGNNGDNRYDDEVEHYTWDAGGGNLNNAQNLLDRRGFSGLAPLPDGTWLIIGGLQTGNDTLLDSTLRASVVANNLVTTSAATLPSPRSRGCGGLLADGRYIVLGGEAAAGPLDEALIYDPINDQFVPFGPSPGPTRTCGVYPLPDGTSAVVVDGRITRYNPP